MIAKTFSKLNFQLKDDYKYYIGVVKADSYGHNSDRVIKSIIDAGCNYLAISSLDEALEVRKKFNIIFLSSWRKSSKYIILIES